MENNNLTTDRTNSSLVIKTLSQDFRNRNNKFSRNQGIIAKCYDKTKSIANIGKNKKIANQKITDFQNGKVGYNEVNKSVKNYQYSQKDATEITLDFLTGLGSFGIYSGIQKLGNFLIPFIPKKIKIPKNFEKISRELFFSRVTKGIGIGLAITGGSIVKPVLRYIDKIYLKKEEKKEHNTFWKDTISGAIDGAMAPVTLLKGGLVGIPLILGENSLQRYLLIKQDDKKSIKDFWNKQKDNLILKAVGITTFAYKGRKLSSSLSSWDKAITQTIKNIKNLKPLEKSNIIQKETLDLLEYAKLLVNKEMITRIINTGNIENIMKILEEKNIFLPKIMQSIPENTFNPLEIIDTKNTYMNTFNEIIRRFKSDCPQSRTIKEAQRLIERTFKDKYTIIEDKALGVGTVAETFLARNNETGKNVVLKIIKKNMSLEKIEKDRNEFIQLIKDKYQDNDNTRFLLKKINNLYDAWSKEIDLSKEMEATEILGRNAKHYNAIKPIEVKDNIYVMEEAKGIQLNKFIDEMKRNGQTISEKDMANLMINYMQVFFEQLLSVPKHGSKVLHADPHPGNIFIDITNTEKPFTFIDTGNVLRYTSEEAIINTLNHLDYIIGNTKGIAKALLKNAELPKGMSESEAIEIVSTGLKEKAYNNKTQIFGGNIFESINNIGLKIMSERNILPDRNNANLFKAETTYISNIKYLSDLIDIVGTSLNKVEDKEMINKSTLLILKEILESIFNASINNKRCTIKEIRERFNYIYQNEEQFYTTILSLLNGPDI